MKPQEWRRWMWVMVMGMALPVFGADQSPKPAPKTVQTQKVPAKSPKRPVMQLHQKSSSSPTASFPVSTKNYRLEPQPGGPASKEGHFLGMKIDYRGFLLDVARSKDPLALINPIGNPVSAKDWENISYDPITRHPTGYKLISLQF